MYKKIGKIRGVLYRVASKLGDLQACIGGLFKFCKRFFFRKKLIKILFSFCRKIS